MIFLNNSGYSGGRSVRPTSCRGVGQFGSISANSHHHQEEESGVFLGIIVASFGIAITLGLVLLPLLICCSSVTRHPLYLSGVGLFVVLLLIGGILFGFRSGIFTFDNCDHKCWWYKNQGETSCCGGFSRQSSLDRSRRPSTTPNYNVGDGKESCIIITPSPNESLVAGTNTVSVTNSVLVSSNETPELASYPSPKLSQDQFPEAEVASKPPQPPPTFNPPTPPRPISCCSSSEAITSVDLHKNSLV